MPSRPNILYFITHDTGRMLGCYERPIRFSPNLDRFARAGITFNRTFCQAPCCGPSRNCAMTGKYSHVTNTLGLGGMGWCLPPEEWTIVDYLNEAGYETVHMGFCHERRYGEMRYQVDGEYGVDERYWQDDARTVVDNAIEYLENRDDSKPFYLNLATHQTHTGSTRGAKWPNYGGPVPEDEVWIPPTMPDLPPIRAYFARWNASLQYLDHHFGRLMEAIDRLGLRENTVIVFTTDHGISALRGKGHVYDFGVEIAHLMHLPFGMRNGYGINHLIPNVDFMPTLLDACGVTYPGNLNGRSFWPLLKDEKYTPHDTIFIERNFHGEHESDTSTTFIDKYDPQRGVRTKDYHYIRHFRPDARERLPYRREIEGFELRRGTECSIDGVYLPELHDARPAEELYDVRHDPWEQWNLIDRPEYAGIKKDLSARLNEWMRATNDPALSPEMPLPLENECFWPTKHTPITVAHR